MKIQLSMHSWVLRASRPEPIEMMSTSNTKNTSASSHLDKDYHLMENPWIQPITYIWPHMYGPKCSFDLLLLYPTIFYLNTSKSWVSDYTNMLFPARLSNCTLSLELCQIPDPLASCGPFVSLILQYAWEASPSVWWDKICNMIDWFCATIMYRMLK